MITLSAYSQSLLLETPLAISFHTWTHQENCFVQLECDGHTGYGEAAPFEPITLDTQEEVFANFEKVRTMDLDPRAVSPEEFHAFLDSKGITSHTARAALDFAFHDLKGRLEGVPVYKLYVEDRHIAPNSVTGFIKDPEAMKKEAADFLERFPHVTTYKIKLSGEQSDFENVKAITEVMPSSMQYVLDANQGYETPEIAIESLNQMADILGNILLVEEPLPKGRLDDLKIVTDAMDRMLIFADESAVDADDAARIIEMKAAHGINIKLQKAGGIWQGKRMAKLAEEAGIKVMVGCMLEGPISIAAAVHFASSTSNVILTDLDLDLLRQPTTNTLCPFENGSRVPLETPGFGIEIDDNHTRALTESDELVWEKVL